MNLLTPLYFAGALAVALPILFHLLRRAPQKKQTFSSLMFLAATPPRFTKRSRISNWLLLLLRALALVLLALAFARPFLRQEIAVASDASPGRHVAILVDTSASMRRDDLWPQAKAQAEQVLATLTPADQAALFFFDRQVRVAFTFEQWKRLDLSQRAPALRAELEAARPTWGGTAIGDAVAQVAEQLATTDNAGGDTAVGRRTLCLISDLQQGGRAEALQGRAWPDGVRLDVRPVKAKDASNAGLQLIRALPDAPDAADERPRVRVSNAAGSGVEQFTVRWAGPGGPVPTTQPQAVYVPAGRGQIARVDWPAAAADADRLLLQGDATDFDNTLYVVRRHQETARIVYAGDDAADDTTDNTQGLAFYLRTAFGDTPQRRIDIALRPGPLGAADLAGTGLLVIGRALTDAEAAVVRQHVDAGGEALWVVRDTAAAGGLPGVTGMPSADVQVKESTAPGFALLSRVDTSHPLFAAFADPRFGDFSRVHFWKHRTLTLPAAAGVRVLASFEGGDPFLVEKSVGRGRLFVMTSGWQPADSQLALSSKFVPLLHGLLRPREGALTQTQFTVGDAVPTPPAGDKPWTARTEPGGAAVANLAAVTEQPGRYTIDTAAGPVGVAVNLAPDESRTAPIAADDFKQWGALLDTGVAAAPSADAQRQAQRAELENRQKLWQWLLVGVLGLIAAETVLAGRLARRADPLQTSRQPSAAGG